MSVRVVVTGSECTGKTTLAQRLAAHYGAPWVPEAARAYAEARQGVLTSADVEPIARATTEALHAAGTPRLLVVDTDLVSTVVYARAYYGACPDWIVAECRAQLGTLYLLCAPDLPWQPDGVRDRPDASDRAAMHAAFEETLREFGARVALVRGDGEARTAAAIAATELVVNPETAP
ncbi:MAG: ATP-binding protein [Gemmatimonadaceae bacterium]|nr:ATP-binding protein [Gemmatimonadaceae bacterium]